MSSDFSENQKAFIRQVVDEASPRIIHNHVVSCPWGKKFNRLIWMGTGILVLLGLLNVRSLSDFFRLVEKHHSTSQPAATVAATNYTP